jgi:hypothetical protein
MLNKARLLTRPTPAVNSPARPPARRDVPLARARAFQFSHFSLEENDQTVLHYAHRATVIHLNDPSKLASCFQGWGLIDLPLRASNEGLRRPRVARARSSSAPSLHRGSSVNTGTNRAILLPAGELFSIQPNEASDLFQELVVHPPFNISIFQ